MRFTGRVKYSKAPDLLALADVAVSPKRFGSGEGNGKLLNYMAMGLPVVAFEDPVNRAILAILAAWLNLKMSSSLQMKSCIY